MQFIQICIWVFSYARNLFLFCWGWVCWACCWGWTPQLKPCGWVWGWLKLKPVFCTGTLLTGLIGWLLPIPKTSSPNKLNPPVFWGGLTACWFKLTADCWLGPPKPKRPISKPVDCGWVGKVWGWVLPKLKRPKGSSYWTFVGVEIGIWTAGCVDPPVIELKISSSSMMLTFFFPKAFWVWVCSGSTFSFLFSSASAVACCLPVLIITYLCILF